VVYIVKRRGPRTDPCGTPVERGVEREMEESMQTDWVRFRR
jgi:hypothetical protein